MVWLVDDTSDHHATTAATLAGRTEFTFVGFLDAEEAVDEYRRLAHADREALPRIILMDFFLGSTRGDLVTRRLRELQPTDAKLTIVGYSSVPSGSERIMAAGADIVVRKHKDDAGRNPTLARWLDVWLAAER